MFVAPVPSLSLGKSKADLRSTRIMLPTQAELGWGTRLHKKYQPGSNVLNEGRK
jgi:hypothetical protein